MTKNRITEIREARGMTVRQLARKANFSGPYVSQMAAGVRNISLANLERLAAALECQPEDLLATDTATNNDVLNIWATIPAERRDLALQVLQSFASLEATNETDSGSVNPGMQPKKRPNNLK